MRKMLVKTMKFQWVCKYVISSFILFNKSKNSITATFILRIKRSLEYGEQNVLQLTRNKNQGSVNLVIGAEMGTSITESHRTSRK